MRLRVYLGAHHWLMRRPVIKRHFAAVTSRVVAESLQSLRKAQRGLSPGEVRQLNRSLIHLSRRIDHRDQHL